ncbi:MAG: aldo/keto reductase [Actinomycetaceae bacterium]|nr:aldo/keto reductase [Actinomycetaceae bacterium]
MSVSMTSLNSGHHIPQFGVGTYKLTGEDATRIVAHALATGYRHIDTAQMYGNEAEVGRAIAASGISREDVFVTTKLDNPNHDPADVRTSFAESLRALGTDYVDLFLIHWPLPDQYGGDFLSTWKAMEEFVADGRARSIGVSNFQVHHLQQLLDGSDTVPAVNQIELHPYFQNREVADFCRKAGIAIEAWAPLVRGAVTGEATIADIAAAHGCTPAQAVLAWHLSKGHVIFPKSATPSRIEENFASVEITLTVADVEAIDALDRGEPGRTGYHPDTMKRGG